jgi:rhodanese-related sulfurtransferase
MYHFLNIHNIYPGIKAFVNDERRCEMASFTLKIAKLTLLGIFLAILPATWVIAGDYHDLISGTEGSWEVKGATTIDVATAKALFDQGVPFVDTRGPNRWAESHIPGAVGLPFSSEAELSKIVSKDQDVVIYGYGYGGRPSPVAEAVFWGYKKVYYFRDGFSAWDAAGYPVAKP